MPEIGAGGTRLRFVKHCLLAPLAIHTQKIKGRVETQPRFKIQYPMKNHGKDAVSAPKRRNKSLKFLQNECCS